MATIIAQLPRSPCADRLVYPRLQDIHDLYLGLPNPGIGQVADGPRDISLPALQVYLLSPLRSNKNLGIHKTLFLFATPAPSPASELKLLASAIPIPFSSSFAF